MENKRYADDDDVIDILELARAVLQHWFVLSFCFISGAILMGGLAYTRPLTYTSTASIFIQTDNTSLANLADIQLGNALSKDFIELATCKPVLDTAIEYIKAESGIEFTREEIQEATNIVNKEGTRLLTFRCVTNDPYLSKVVAHAMATATSEQVSAIMKSDEPTRVDLAESGEVNGRGIKRATALGGILGFLIPAIIYACQFLFNARITTEDDVKKYLGVSVIGVISLDRESIYKNKKK